MPAGIRLAFRSDTTLVAGHVDAYAEASAIDLAVDGEVVGSAEWASSGAFTFDGLSPGWKTMRPDAAPSLDQSAVTTPVAGMPSETVSAADVQRIAQTFFDPKQIALTVLGNLENFKIGREDLVC